MLDLRKGRGTPGDPVKTLRSAITYGGQPLGHEAYVYSTALSLTPRQSDQMCGHERRKQQLDER